MRQTIVCSISELRVVPQGTQVHKIMSDFLLFMDAGYLKVER